MAATSLYDTAYELLLAVMAAIDQSPGGPVARGYVSPGPPIWDGTEQVTVHVGSIQVADTQPLQPPLQPFHRVASTGIVVLVPLVVTALRYCPMPVVDGEGALLSAPDPEDIVVATKNILGDAWAIWNYILAAKRQGHLFLAPDGTAKTREFQMDPPQALQQQGGAGGFQLQCRVQVDGYAPAVTT